MKKSVLLIITLLIGCFTVNAQSKITPSFFSNCDAFFKNNVSNGLVDYAAVKTNPKQLFEIIQVIDKADITDLDTDSQLAFYINAYNLNVIKGVVLNYPIKSVMDVSGFFDGEKHWFSQKRMTLNDLENKVIRPTFNDARTHFALVCGAVGCPPIINEAYTPENLNTLLDRQTRAAINDNNFTQRVGNKVSVSKIFEWYAEDFGKGKKGLIEFLNNYTDEPIANNSSISYYPYNWQLNNGTIAAKSSDVTSIDGRGITENKSTANVNNGLNDISILPAPDERYYVSALYNKGQFEINVFNNMFTQKTKNPIDGGRKFTGRTTFFTTYINALFGITDRFNIGFDSKIRSVAQNNETTAELFEVFGFSNNDVDVVGSYTRFQPTAIGPKVKYTPFKNFGNISIQQTLYIPIGKNLEGGNGKGFADWQGLTLWNQLYYDTTIGDKFGLFAEFDILLENFTSAFADDHYWQFSTPITLIPSYFPTPKITVYALVGSAPQWAFSQSGGAGVNKTYVPFNQYGVGFKYQFSKNWLGEILYTEFINSANNSARTFNFGLRYIKR